MRYTRSHAATVVVIRLLIPANSLLNRFKPGIHEIAEMRDGLEQTPDFGLHGRQMVRGAVGSGFWGCSESFGHAN